MASLFSFKWKSIILSERKLSIKEPMALAALFVLIWRRELSVEEVEGEKGQAPVWHDSISSVAS